MAYLMAEIRVQRHEAGLPTPDPRVLTSCLPGYYYRGFLTCITDITDITDNCYCCYYLLLPLLFPLTATLTLRLPHTKCPCSVRNVTVLCSSRVSPAQRIRLEAWNV